MNTASSKWISAEDTKDWRSALAKHARFDVCHLPEYHQAYSTRGDQSKAMLFLYENGEKSFCFPFLLSPVKLLNEETPYFDIGSVYGYSGPLSNSEDPDFIQKAWKEFDGWALSKRVVSEFTRFSLFLQNERWAHLECKVEDNRPIALFDLPKDPNSVLSCLPTKTRNMIRKAERADLSTQLLDLDSIAAFDTLYRETMNRNEAPEFFFYDEKYWRHLGQLKREEFLMVGVYQKSRLVAAAIGLISGEFCLYHLGASLKDFGKLGAGNLSLYALAQACAQKGVSLLNLGGGRTTSIEDPLFRFKKSNGSRVSHFKIGKRVIDKEAYLDLKNMWNRHKNEPVPDTKLQFYR